MEKEQQFLKCIWLLSEIQCKSLCLYVEMKTLQREHGSLAHLHLCKGLIFSFIISITNIATLSY